MDTDVAAALQRTRRYWVTDGLWELSSGIGTVVIAITLMQWRRFPLLAMISCLLMITLHPRLLAWARDRITYPRSGYAAPLVLPIRPNVQHGIIVVFAVILSLPVLGVAFSLTQPDWSHAIFRMLDISLPTGGCLLVSVWFVNTARYSKLPRFYLLAGFSLLVGLVFCGQLLSPQGNALLESDTFMSIAALPFLCLGSALILSGAVALRAYLRANPQPMEDES